MAMQHKFISIHYYVTFGMVNTSSCRIYMCHNYIRLIKMAILLSQSLTPSANCMSFTMASVSQSLDTCRPYIYAAISLFSVFETKCNAMALGS